MSDEPRGPSGDAPASPEPGATTPTTAAPETTGAATTAGGTTAAGTVARERTRGDVLAIASLILGGGAALAGVRTPLTLVTGCAVALAGVLLAVRGDRRVPAPRLMSAALSLAIVALVAVALIGTWEDWQVGQQLADGASVAAVRVSLRPWARVTAALRSLSLFSGLSLLLGAAVTRLGGDSGK